MKRIAELAAVLDSSRGLSSQEIAVNTGRWVREVLSDLIELMEINAVNCDQGKWYLTGRGERIIFHYHEQRGMMGIEPLVVSVFSGNQNK